LLRDKRAKLAYTNKLLVGPIQCMAEPEGYRLKGATRLGTLLFDEIAAPVGETRVKLASPQGPERIPHQFCPLRASGS
jgi:hypothetical protein